MSKKLTQEEILSRFHKTHGDKYNYSKVEFKNVDEKVCIICPKHGEFWQTPYKHINRKQGCPECGRLKTQQSKILPSEQIYEKVSNRKDYKILNIYRKQGRIFLNLVCNKCNKKFDMAYNHFKRGENCHCYRRSNKEAFIIKAENKFPKLFDYSLFIYKKSNVKSKIICKKCNKIFERTPHEFLRSGACPYCRPYKTENKIAIWLEKNGFEQDKSFFREYSFEDLKDKLCLRFDYYIPSKKLLIEFNGIQHYKWYKVYQPTYHDFLVQKHHDWLKRKYAKKHNIKLLVISYKDKYYLEKILEENIK